ncbi:ArnT family glycosyltransferase, partial [Acidovorax sp. ST3]|uniref:ArnT family glycosyltransferase n=1 Tax=Acidovorax sp. ST3 TaxID=2219062 RepID=UPI003519B2D2
GGEPEPRDYGRMLADAALLLLLATVGILQRTHETTVVPAIMACQALAFYSLARTVDRPVTGSTTLGIALAASFLTRGWIGALPIMVAALLAFYPRGPLWKCKRWLPWAALVAALRGHNLPPIGVVAEGANLAAARAAGLTPVELSTPAARPAQVIDTAPPNDVATPVPSVPAAAVEIAPAPTPAAEAPADKATEKATEKTAD